MQSNLNNYKNPDDDVRGVWNSAAYTCAKNQFDELTEPYYAWSERIQTR